MAFEECPENRARTAASKASGVPSFGRGWTRRRSQNCSHRNATAARLFFVRVAGSSGSLLVPPDICARGKDSNEMRTAETRRGKEDASPNTRQGRQGDVLPRTRGATLRTAGQRRTRPIKDARDGASGCQRSDTDAPTCIRRRRSNTRQSVIADNTIQRNAPGRGQCCLTND